jgi:hypothetical protein
LKIELLVFKKYWISFHGFGIMVIIFKGFNSGSKGFGVYVSIVYGWFLLGIGIKIVHLKVVVTLHIYMVDSWLFSVARGYKKQAINELF